MFGVGLRSPHYSYLESRPKTSLDWFEVISENYFETEGRPITLLELVRQDYEISLHGVGLSIGYCGELDMNYLKKLKALIDRVGPFRVSDHLCFTGLPGKSLHNLLPFPYTRETLAVIASKVLKVQDFLKRPMAFENLSAYFTVNSSEMTEWEFLSELHRLTNCQILFDVNNVYVNSVNQKFDPLVFLNAIPKEAVSEIHLAGYSDCGDYLFDTHSNPVFPEVWELYKKAILKFSNVPILVEWDQDIPEFSRLEQEAMTAKAIWRETYESQSISA